MNETVCRTDGFFVWILHDSIDKIVALCYNKVTAVYADDYNLNTESVILLMQN